MYEYRDSQLTRGETWVETFMGTCTEVENQAVINKLLEAPYGQVWVLKTPGVPTLL